jgi:hypothetical protein
MTVLAGLYLTAVDVQAATAPTTDVDPTTGHGEEWGKAAPIGLLVIVVLCIAGYFLARSFSRQMKKVPASFDPPADDEAGPTGTDGTTDPASVAVTDGPGRAAADPPEDGGTHR